MSGNEDYSLYWEGLRRGDKQALFNLYNDMYFHLIRFGLKLTGDDELVKDSINQLFLNLWDKKDKLTDVSNVRSYLFSVLRNTIIDELKHSGKVDEAIRRRLLEEELDELPYEEIIIRVQNDEELKAKLQLAIKKLTPRQIELIQLRFFEGMSYEQIANTTSQSVKTAYNTIYDAVKMLRKLLK
ncbi:RNA polymerase sigma factor [Daejeonella lutea]|uniref:Sigma-70 region 2 n=1 Tax=Daejeonella lutea TaxID=572036 RepID=A0A1T5CU38_9SPHI|nr:sigma-70 family RNA polymerase sigma factor [Daejeonella lutea]SKB62831.1 Sigma-70 region 2 [Daejeonella lutea]